MNLDKLPGGNLQPQKTPVFLSASGPSPTFTAFDPTYGKVLSF